MSSTVDNRGKSETLEVIVNPDGSLTPTDGDREPDRTYAVLTRQDDGSYREGLADLYRYVNRRRHKRHKHGHPRGR